MRSFAIVITIFVLLFAVCLTICMPAAVYAAGNKDNAVQQDEGLFDEYAVEVNTRHVPDPFYWLNYGMYQFNDKLYFWMIKPVTKGYKAIVPSVLRRDFKNFFYNLLFPVRFVNSVLQGKFSGAGSELKIFIINSSAGCFGFGTPAQDLFKLHNSEEDLGQTFGSYSIGEGFYIVLPVLGPSTLRDLTGNVGDFFLEPVNYVRPANLSLGIQAFDRINSVSFKLGEYKTLKDSAIDPYSAIKDAYIQLRRGKIKH